LGAIASEKAGIMRSGRPALLAHQRPAAMRALWHACREIGAACEVVTPLEHGVPLAGEHQRQNAALAVAAARKMGAAVDAELVGRALRRLHWPGRFEVVRGPGEAQDERSSPIVLDGAHNGASAEALSKTLKTFAGGRSISLVVAINRDKDARAVLRPLLRVSELVWATQTRNNPRALDARSLADLCQRLDADVVAEPDLSVALEQARTTRPGGTIVCVTGSLLLVGQARATLGLPIPEHLW
jgi:dihydrofolate synthase/folylpolyglutamate synthase